MRRKHSIRILCLVLTCSAFLFCMSTAMALPEIRPVPLSIGARGENVVALQSALQELGLYSGVLDGRYGEGTASAVRRLQRLLGLYADGQFGSSSVRAYQLALDNGSLSVSSPILANAASAPMPTDSLKGIVVGIDPGHQRKPDLSLEPIAPGSSRTKEKMSAGSVGSKTGIYEYEITLQIAAKLKKLLESAGAKVVMARAKHDVALSNRERALLMNNAKVDCWIRVHCDHSKDADKSGVAVLYPSIAGNAAIAKQSKAFAEAVLDSVSQQTGAAALDSVAMADQTGFNWSDAPVITIELGFLSNPIEDVRLNRSAYQTSCARGMLLGITEYLKNR